jgi:phosphatidate cytidylyltransferase
LIIVVFLTVFQSDHGALVFGKLWGVTPISAFYCNKTRQGLLGAVVFPVLSQLVFWAAPMFFPSIPEISLFHYIMISLVVGPVSVMGDLTESFLKRCAGVKDSGTILPGHGGLLDRMDSLFIPLLFAYFYANAFLA